MFSYSSERRHSLQNLCDLFSEKERKRCAKKLSCINSALVSYLTSLLAYENKILFDSDKNRAETIELFFLNCILAPSS